MGYFAKNETLIFEFTMNKLHREMENASVHLIYISQYTNPLTENNF